MLIVPFHPAEGTVAVVVGSILALFCISSFAAAVQTSSHDDRAAADRIFIRPGCVFAGWALPRWMCTSTVVTVASDVVNVVI